MLCNWFQPFFMAATCVVMCLLPSQFKQKVSMENKAWKVGKIFQQSAGKTEVFAPIKLLWAQNAIICNFDEEVFLNVWFVSYGKF